MTRPRGLSAEHVVAIAFAAVATACLVALGCAAPQAEEKAAPVPVAPPQPPPEPVQDRERPEVEVLAPAGGGVLGGVSMEVRWTARDAVALAENPVSLQFSDDGGRTWKDLADGLKAEGTFAWTPPRAALGDCRIRAVALDAAGNRGEAVSGRFGVDTDPPEARAVGPDRAASLAVSVSYDVRNRGAAPVAKVVLWVRAEGAREWRKHGEDDDARSPVPFAAPADGRYGLYVTCATGPGLAAGIAQKEPGDGTEPQLVLSVDATPPRLALEAPLGGEHVLAGSAVDVRWTSVEADPDPAGARVFHSTDDGVTWSLVAERVDPSKGTWRWVVPSAGGGRQRIRVSVSDRFGNTAQADSPRAFTVDADRPSVTVTEKPSAVTRSTKIAVKYAASDPTSGIDRVVLYARPAGNGVPYKELAENRSREGTLEAELPGEGNWALLVVARDAAGQVSSDVARAPEPHLTVVVDVTKPELALKETPLPQEGRTWINPNWEVEWRATDALSPPERLRVRVEHSPDGGRTWFVAGTTANVGKFDLRAHLFPGKRYRVRLVASDEAGNETEKTSGDFDPGEIPTAPLSLRGVEPGRPVVAGTVIAVAWATQDRTVREAALELSKDGGKTWEPHARMAATTMPVAMPDREGAYHLRATAKDSVGRTLVSNTVAFEVVSGVRQARIVTHASAEPGKPAQVLFEPKDLLRTAKAVRLEISGDAREWRKLRDVSNALSSFTAPELPGEYVVRAVVTDQDGKEHDSNHARLRVGKAGVQLLNFRGGRSYAAGSGALVMVRTDADPAELRLDFSDSGGKEWRRVEPDDLRPVKGGLFWKIPLSASAACRLRVSYADAQGRIHADQSDRDFAIEEKPAAAAGSGLAIETPLPPALKGGTVFELRWSGADPEAPVKLSLAVGEKTEPVADPLPPSGAFAWKVPRIDARACALIFESGGKTVRTGFFEIDSSAPAVDGVDIEIPKK